MSYYHVGEGPGDFAGAVEFGSRRWLLGKTLFAATHDSMIARQPVHDSVPVQPRGKDDWG